MAKKTSTEELKLLTPSRAITTPVVVSETLAQLLIPALPMTSSQRLQHDFLGKLEAPAIY